MEAWIMMPGDPRPSVIVKYGTKSLQCFDQAHKLCERIVAMDRTKVALQAFLDLIDGNRDDSDRVVEMIEDLLYDLS